MFLSTRSRYGLRAIFLIAQNYGVKPISLKQISNNEGISLHYLEQLFLHLKKDQLVKSIRGSKGGYILAKSPNKITVKDIITSLEGPMLASNCVLKTDCELKNNCSTRIVWKSLTNALNEAMEKITLQDMLNDQKELDAINISEHHKINKTKC